jgi:hypothetical protein
MPLERVHVDLCGPIPVASRSGRLYSMSVIDYHSGYVWSSPLKTILEALSILRGWHRTVENQSGHKLKILVTDNGELVSNSMTAHAWCADHGSLYLRPKRSCRAPPPRRSMRLACSAPASLWDEFCATAACPISPPRHHSTAKPRMNFGL